VSEVRPARPPALREARALEATGVPNGLQGPAAPAGPPPPIAPAADLPSPDVLSVPEPSFDQQMGTLAARAAACFRSIAASRSIPVQEAEAIATELIALAPLEHGRDLRGFYTESPDWLASHSMIVAGLGVHLARALEWTPGQVKKFALACLLHDVGMLFIPRHFLIAPGKLNPAQRAQVQRHPQIGREVIQGSRAFGAQIHLVAQDHHERWDGSGYPSGKKGKEVDLPARIVGFLDCFAALISSRPHRPALLYTQALRFMSHATVLGLHDPTILMHFRNIFTDLPVGSWLRLVDGRIGRVVGADPGNPRRHCIRILEERPGLRDETPVWMETEEPSATEIPPPAARHALSAGDPSPAEHRVQVSGSQATNSLS